MSATFIPVPGFALVCGGQSIERQYCDMGKEFRACAAQCEEIAPDGDGERRRQYKELARVWMVLATLASQRHRSFG
jgi:hypothetical protein